MRIINYQMNVESNSCIHSQLTIRIICKLVSDRNELAIKRIIQKQQSIHNENKENRDYKQNSDDFDGTNPISNV